MMWNFDLRTQKHCNADGLSRLPLFDEALTPCESVSTASLFNVNKINSIPLRPESLRKETVQDPTLSKVLSYVMQGWPSNVLEAELKPYFLCLTV